MKSIYNFLNTSVFIAFVALVGLASCSESFPDAIDSSGNQTVLKSIKITNAGEQGNIVVEGVIDESKKTISFPRLDPKSNFAGLKFDITASDGSKLEQDSYNFGFKDGDTEKTIVIKLTNGPRFRDYFATVRLRVPVYGGDFTKPTFYDYTPNEIGNPIYGPFVGGTVRGTGFNGEYVFIVDRNGNTPHLLRVSDLKQNKIDPIYLNNTGIVGGTFTLHSGAMEKGHIYAANLSGGQTIPLKIYHWTDPKVAPTVIADINVAQIPNAGVRHGDNMSVSLDDKGNGFIYFGDNAATKILRFSVTNYTTINNPTVFAMPVTGAGSWTSYNRVGNTDEYLFTGHDAAIFVMNASGQSAYNMAKTAVPVRGSDARVFYFNGERYLLMLTAARTGSEATVLYVYNITRGATVAEAIRLFETESDRKPVFEYSLLGSVNLNPTTQTGFYVKKDAAGNDESLLLYGSTFAAGFVVVEVPKKQSED